MKKCLRCGKEFQEYNQQHAFCSHDCSRQWHRSNELRGRGYVCPTEPYYFECEKCGKQVYVVPADGDRRWRYCGLKCKQIARAWRKQQTRTAKQSFHGSVTALERYERYTNEL